MTVSIYRGETLVGRVWKDGRWARHVCLDVERPDDERRPVKAGTYRAVVTADQLDRRVDLTRTVTVKAP